MRGTYHRVQERYLPQGAGEAYTPPGEGEAYTPLGAGRVPTMVPGRDTHHGTGQDTYHGSTRLYTTLYPPGYTYHTPLVRTRHVHSSVSAGRRSPGLRFENSL